MDLVGHIGEPLWPELMEAVECGARERVVRALTAADSDGRTAGSAYKLFEVSLSVQFESSPELMGAMGEFLSDVQGVTVTEVRVKKSGLARLSATAAVTAWKRVGRRDATPTGSGDGQMPPLASPRAVTAGVLVPKSLNGPDKHGNEQGAAHAGRGIAVDTCRARSR